MNLLCCGNSGPDGLRHPGNSVDLFGGSSRFDNGLGINGESVNLFRGARRFDNRFRITGYRSNATSFDHGDGRGVGVVVKKLTHCVNDANIDGLVVGYVTGNHLEDQFVFGVFRSTEGSGRVGVTVFDHLPGLEGAGAANSVGGGVPVVDRP